MKDSFIFYASFDEALRELPDKSRLRIYDAITDYALRGVEPELKGIEKAVFSLIKPQVKANNQRYENGCKGGAPKNNQNAKKFVLESDKKTTEKQPNEEKKQPKNNQKQPNENENENENDTPFLFPPQGEKKTTFADDFFAKYPRYAKDRDKMRLDVKYDVLIAEFERSKYLRSLYTVKQINELYPLIINGEFRDQDKPTKPDAIAGIEAKAERERWYEARRREAESKAESVLDRFLQDEDFSRIHKRLRTIEYDIAKAEVDADTKKMTKFTQEKARLTMQYRGIIERNGMTEEDLMPIWHCSKCKDTGYLQDGKMCDCYEGGNGNGLGKTG